MHVLYVYMIVFFILFMKDVHIYNNKEKYTDDGNFSKKK
jgi:hypothetical protein